jgi:hypothetical protein
MKTIRHDRELIHDVFPLLPMVQENINEEFPHPIRL